MKAFINRDGCIGCGLCTEVCPEAFHMAKDGLAEAYTAPTDETIAKAREAGESCPVEVITIEE